MILKQHCWSWGIFQIQFVTAVCGDLQNWWCVYIITFTISVPGMRFWKLFGQLKLPCWRLRVPQTPLEITDVRVQRLWRRDVALVLVFDGGDGLWMERALQASRRGQQRRDARLRGRQALFRRHDHTLDS